MGLMDQAKKLAEQAQQKLDEAQKKFNEGGSTAGQQPGGQRFDQHGRPAPPPSAEPAADSAPDPFRPIEP